MSEGWLTGKPGIGSDHEHWLFQHSLPVVGGQGRPPRFVLLILMLGEGLIYN